jgi:hypothetical protein
MDKVTNLIYRDALQFHFADVVIQATSLFVTAVTHATDFNL